LVRRFRHPAWTVDDRWHRWRSVLGLTFKDVIGLFEQDPATTHLVVIGEIGGTDEEHAASCLVAAAGSKTVAFISGRTAPEGKRMGHAGAINLGQPGKLPRARKRHFRKAGVASRKPLTTSSGC